MSKMKKLLAMFLALAMVLGMSISTMAYDAIEIEINHKGSGTFAKLQLIEADTTKDTGWDFTTDAIAKDYTDAFGITSGEQVPTEVQKQKAIWMLIGNQDEKDNTYIVTLPEGVSAAEDSQIAAALASVKAGHTFTGHVANVTVDAPGVYYIDGVETNYVYSPMAAYVSFLYSANGVPSSLECGEVEAKKTPTTINKSVVDDDLVTEIGEIKTYKVTGTVPYIPMTDSGRTYYVTDTISGAEYVTAKVGDDDKVVVTVKIGDEITNGAAGTTYYGELTGATSFTVNLDPVIANNTYANKDIEISYQAVVKDVKVSNTVNAGGFGSDSVTVYTGEITLTKYAADADNTNLTDNKKLAGATYKVYKKVVVNDDEVIKWATFDTTNYKFITWVDSEEGATPVVTGNDGTLKVQGLNLGTYYFKETVAPVGYSINEVDSVAKLALAVGATQATDTIVAGTNMIDTTLAHLPSTGGIGTTIFTVAGCGIMIAAAYLFFNSRRREEA